MKDKIVSFFSEIIWRSFFEHFVQALGALSSIATLVSFLLMWNQVISNGSKLAVWGIIVIGILILILCAVYAFAMISRKSRIELKLNPNFNLTIEKGDLFSKKGVIVIPVNEYFDTIVDEIIINSETIHGQWINKYWKDRISDLDQNIEKALKKAESDKKLVPVKEDASRSSGNKTKYEVGSCISLRDGENTYVLLVLTHFDENNKANLSREEFSTVIGGLFAYLNSEYADQAIYLPLFGTGLTRLNRSHQRILSFLVDVIDFNHSRMSFPHGVNIEIKPDKFWNVNLNQIEYHFKNTFKDED